MSATLDVFQGYPIRETLTLYQDTALALPVDLTGCTIVGGIGREGEAPLVPLTCEILDAINGEILITGEAADTLQLTGSLYSWGVIVTDSLGHPNPLPLGDVSVQSAPVPPAP